VKKLLQKWLGIDLLDKNLQNVITSIENTNDQVEHELSQHKLYVEDKVHQFLDETRIDAKLGFRGNHTIVLTGVYKNRGYVEFYDLDSTEFHYLVEKLKDMKKEHLIRHVDGPLGFDFKGYFNIKGKANEFI
jgi:uncharacterized protein YdcH (DUF465 family)